MMDCKCKRHKFKTFSKVFTNAGAIMMVHRLMNTSQWFEVTPLPDDEWQITVKIENKHFVIQIWSIYC